MLAAAQTGLRTKGPKLSQKVASTAMTKYTPPITAVTKYKPPQTAVVKYKPPPRQVVKYKAPQTAVALYKPPRSSRSNTTRAMSTRSMAPVESSPPRKRAQTAATPQPDIRNHPDFVGSRGSHKDYPTSYLLGFIPIGRDIPDVASKIAHDDTGRYEGPAVRFDQRTPEDMMKAGAFRGRGASLNITDHQLGGHRLDDSGLVSFSRTHVGTQPIRGSRDGFLYFAELGQHNTFDVERFYKPSMMSADVRAQQEVASTKVDLTQVTAVYDTKRNQTIRHPFTPRSDLAMDDFSHSGMPR